MQADGMGNYRLKTEMEKKKKKDLISHHVTQLSEERMLMEGLVFMEPI